MSFEKPAAGLRFLVVDDQPFQRRLVAETLRAFGASRVEYADSTNQCLEVFSYFTPDVLITGWDMSDGDGIELVRRLRAGDAGPILRRLPIIMAATRNKERDIEVARNSGVDEFLLRPFNTASLIARVEAVTKRRRDFVESVVYVGPCRRRKMISDYEGPLRRLFDSDDAEADTPDVQIKKGLARMYAERIMMLLPEATPGNRNGMRDLSLACAQLQALARDLGERLLMRGADSLLHYVRGVGAEGELNMDVIRAHLDAIVQLAELPNSRADIRQAVASELGVMVEKKLKQAAATFVVD